MMSNLKILLGFLAVTPLVFAHVSMSPNGMAASGGYFKTTMKVPHGKFNGSHNMYTTRIELEVPPGILAVSPQEIPGWKTTIDEPGLPESEWYHSHSNMIKTKPTKVTWQANTFEDGLHNDYLMVIDLQFKFGCVFNDPTYHTTTGTLEKPQPHTVWLPVTQISSHTGTLDHDWTERWTNAGYWADEEGGESTATVSKKRPCPYIYIYPGNRCKWPDDSSGTPSHPNGGMMWFDKYLPYNPNGEWREFNQITELIQKEMEDFETMRNMMLDAKSDASQALGIGIAGLVLAATALGFFGALVIFRVAAKEAFASTIAGAAVPMVKEHKGAIGVQVQAGLDNDKANGFAQA